MSDNICILCQDQVRKRQQSLQCRTCLRHVHRTCTSITQDEYREFYKGNNTETQPWICFGCNIQVTVRETEIHQSIDDEINFSILDTMDTSQNETKQIKPKHVCFNKPFV
jgi:hypothetical protein